MKKLLLLFTVILFIISCKTKSKIQQQANQPVERWKLIWADEFNYKGAPDARKWSFAGRNRADWACYCADSKETAYVKDGSLYVSAILSKDTSDSSKYQTGCIQSKGKFSFIYGKVEVRAKLAKGKGSWPAIWMMPEKGVYGRWPHSGEIDIMEQLNSDTIVYQTLHSNYVDVQNKKEYPKYFITAPYQVDQYNVYGLEWFPDRLDFFINGKKTFTYPKLQEGESKQWPFDQKFYIILNQALGGNWVGSISDQNLPVQMMVDWVRVYKNYRH